MEQAKLQILQARIRPQFIFVNLAYSDTVTLQKTRPFEHEYGRSSQAY